jgi:methylglutaconyl-CoA hydratase
MPPEGPSLRDEDLARLRAGLETAPVRVERLGGIGLRVTLARSEKRNAISIATAKGLTALLDGVASMPSVRLVAIAGDGDDFCGGVDLGDRGSPDPLENIGAMADLFRAIARLPQYSVALVSGVAFGAGLGIVAACDSAVATADSRFGTPEARSGLIPSVISPYILRAIGRRAAISLFTTGLPIDAERALGLGLIVKVVADRSVLDAELEVLRDGIRRVAPDAMRAAKQLSDFDGRPIDAALVTQTVERTVIRMQSPEIRHGLKAFRDKSLPPWALEDESENR